MYIQRTSTESLFVIFSALLILCLICVCAYCLNFKKRRRQITMSPQQFPKAWFVVRQELIVHQTPHEFV